MTRYLSEAQILAIHDAVIDAHGGLRGVRDIELLRSAIAQPYASMFGQLLHPTLFDQGAAYLYHIARNHPFLDGNKRTATEACDVFLGIQGYTFQGDFAEYEELVVQVAQGNVTKQELAAFFQANYTAEV